MSTGQLGFPSAEHGADFGKLKVQAILSYLMKLLTQICFKFGITIAYQVTMTLSGSIFPGAMGSMPIEHSCLCS